MIRKLLIAANWKMNAVPDGALDENSPFRPRNDIDVIIFPTMLHVHECIKEQLITGAQFATTDNPGSRTGDVCMELIAQAGCRYVICGHSERRKYHDETDEDVAAQAVAALDKNMHPIVCVGETQEERDADKTKAIVERQIQGLPLESDITIAYEPRWAIGTGVTPEPEEAEEVHAHIRSLIPADRRELIRILYGGSMNPENAKGFLEQPDIDGGLIGGAALKPEQFGEIVKIATQIEN